MVSMHETLRCMRMTMTEIGVLLVTGGISQQDKTRWQSSNGTAYWITWRVCFL